MKLIGFSYFGLFYTPMETSWISFIPLKNLPTLCFTFVHLLGWSYYGTLFTLLSSSCFLHAVSWEKPNLWHWKNKNASKSWKQKITFVAHQIQINPMWQAIHQWWWPFRLRSFDRLELFFAQNILASFL